MPPPVDPAALMRARVADHVRGRLMQMALRELLNQVQGARAALPHLAALEEALGRRGATAIAEVPAHWLGKITGQLSSLPLRDDDHELQDLYSALCHALRQHQMPASAPPPRSSAESSARSHEYLSDFHHPSRLEVREISHSSFAEEFPTQAGVPRSGPGCTG